MKIVGGTHVGMVRARNEDTFRYGTLEDGTAWALVCDGMGGVHGGQLASTIAADMVSEKIKKCYNPSMSVSSLENLLLSAVTTANVIVYDRGDVDYNLKGMGTTIVASIAKDNEACIAHVGDSRAYITDGKEIRQVTKDHSLVQEMYDSGKISADELENHPQKNIITRAMGVSEGVEIDFNYVCLNKNEALILCSDGLSGLVSKERILEIYNNTDFDCLAEEYIKEANKLGGKDNITVVVMKGTGE
ncbi:MAG: Stp1/IreP family PP2C-type Ser/Thr phosphatase [Clostridia bacterium]|nr:Stp1/IreP family PP2C-type Ser/Thr phosphatase [Clostridia bacterium]